jgi:hypothetical protein
MRSMVEGAQRASCADRGRLSLTRGPLHRTSCGPPRRSGEDCGLPQQKWGPVSPPAPTVSEDFPAPEGPDPPAERFRASRRSLRSGVSRAPRRGRSPERFAARRDPKAPPGAAGTCRLRAIASACASALPYREARGLRLSRPERRRLRRAALPRSRSGSRGKPARRPGFGWTGNRPSPSGPSSCRASAEAAASAWPWLAPGCRCRGGFVSRPRLARSDPEGFSRSGRGWGGDRPFPSGRLWPRMQAVIDRDSAKAESGCG